MIKEPSWRAKVMYIAFAFALVFGLASAVITTASTEASAEEINPDFDGTPRICNGPPCCVTFTNLTVGGNLPYQNAIWDFGDGNIEVGAVNYEDTITHCYLSGGVFTVGLTLTDADGSVFYQIERFYITVEEGPIDVDVDIKPGSFPNSINVKSKGVLPVAILGTEDFDVMEVDPATVALTYPLFAGVSPEVSPLRWNWEDVNEDGFVDFVFKFDTQELMILTMTHEPDGAEMMLQLIGNLMDGSPIEGYDTVRIINK